MKHGSITSIPNHNDSRLSGQQSVKLAQRNPNSFNFIKTANLFLGHPMCYISIYRRMDCIFYFYNKKCINNKTVHNICILLLLLLYICCYVYVNIYIYMIII